MKRVGTLLAVTVAAFAQSSSTITVSNGVQIQVDADLGNPTGQEQLSVELARASGDSFYRIFRDQNHLAVFAYQLQVSLSGDALNATAKPAADDFAARYPNADAGKPTPSLSSDQVLGPLGSGKSATVTLFNIPGMGLSVRDVVRVKIDENGGAGAIHFSGLRVFQGGRLISGPPPPGAVAGKFAMFYLPGRGGFFFSSEPVAGRPFVATGVVDLNRMHFLIGNDEYDCTASSPIFSGVQLWVYHDPSYAPAGTWTQDRTSTAPGAENFFAAAADSLGWWLR